MPSPSLTIAVFDFDNTLVTGDSFFPFLGYTAGWLRTTLALKDALFFAVWDSHRPEAADARTYIKAFLMRRLLKGRKPEHLEKALEKLSAWEKWNEPIKQKLIEHHKLGHHIVIASGGLDLYLTALLKDVSYNAIICTETEIVDGRLTGRMANGNCVRERKAELVAQYIAAHGPFEDSWGYGNLPHDLPMLKLLKHQIIV
jgi:HAD superfamily hydrolase (TIGR01490 family)